MSREKFQDLAAARSLDPATIDLLIAEKYDNEEALSRMTNEQLKSLDITEAQRTILEKWLADLAAGNKTDTEAESKVANEASNAGHGGINKVEQDYEEPGTPKPSRYEKCINIAIVGQDGEAKAALVNIVREIDSEHEDAAKADNNELAPYRFGKIDNMLLWLLPSSDKGDDEALKRAEFELYDAIIVCYTGSVTDGAIWLATEARKGHGDVFVVKADVDADIEADKKEKGDSHDEKAVLEQLRTETTDKLALSDGVQLFLVSSKRQFENQWDMPTLVSKISDVKKKAEKKAANVEQAAGEKKPDANSTETAKIEKTAATLLSQVKDVVARAAKKANIGLLQKELTKYKKSFGVEKLDLPNVNLDALDEKVHQLMPDKKKLKDTFMACFGGRSKGAQFREAKERIRTTIEDEAPTLMENAINACKTAALEQLTKEAL